MGSVMQKLIAKREFDPLLDKVLWPWVVDSMAALQEDDLPEKDRLLASSVVRFSAHLGLLFKELNICEVNFR